MLLHILLIVVGIVLVIKGADWMTDGAVSIARRMKIPAIIIGLTIVAMGTSMPEFFVSLMSALKGTPDLAVGNVVGSNIFNTLLIVGVAAMVTPIVVSRSTVRKDMPWSMLAALMLTLMCLDSRISLVDGIILLAAFITFVLYTLYEAKKGKNKEEEDNNGKNYSPLVACALIVVGLASLVIGSNVFVDHATAVAQQLGVSEAVIGLTIVAGGTSLPELATSVVAARKGQSAIAIGNVIGSNVYNVLMIIGVTGIIHPMQITGITLVDLLTMAGSMVILWLFSFTKFKVERWEGAVLTAIFAAYMGWLLAQVI